MKKIISFFVVVLYLTSCGQNDKFTISGIVDGAEGQMLYLERTALMGTEMLDSVKLKSSGKFSFRESRPQYPDLYKLRLGKRFFAFPVDSCEHITIKAIADSIAFPHNIEGSDNALQIQQLRRSIVNLQASYNRLAKGDTTVEDFQQQIEAHKQLAQKIILENPRSIVAYYAIFQKVGNYFMFSPYDKSDRPYCAAVATSFHVYMPDYDRSISLYNLVMDAIKNERQEQNAAYLQELIQQAGTGLLDIALPDLSGNERTLSSLVGKVILLDFSLFETEQSVAYTFELRDLYNRFASRGFEIYQVSLDRNELLWKMSCENLPWVCVHDKNGPNASCLRTYNVQNLPTSFLIDKTGTVLGRNISFDKLPAEIEKCLQ